MKSGVVKVMVATCGGFLLDNRPNAHRQSVTVFRFEILTPHSHDTRLRSSGLYLESQGGGGVVMFVEHILM